MIDCLLKAMGERLHNEFAQSASLHGIPVPIRGIGHDVPASEGSEDKETEDRAYRAAQSRVSKGPYKP